MSLMLKLALALCFPLAAAQAVADEPTRYLELSNRAHDTLIALSVAEPGSQSFRDVPLGALPGGGNATTVAIAGAACRYDLRFTFKNGRSMIYPDVDVCGTRVSVRPLPPTQRSTRDVADATRTSP